VDTLHKRWSKSGNDQENIYFYQKDQELIHKARHNPKFKVIEGGAQSRHISVNNDTPHNVDLGSQNRKAA
jgi:hypothetical protein